jgi:hypothetical protein
MTATQNTLRTASAAASSSDPTGSQITGCAVTRISANFGLLLQGLDVGFRRADITSKTRLLQPLQRLARSAADSYQPDGALLASDSSPASSIGDMVLTRVGFLCLSQL